MNKQSEQYFARLRVQSLSDEDRFAMRQRIQALQKEIPVSQGWLSRHLLQLKTPRLFFIPKPMIIGLIIAIALTMSSGVSLAAEQSLPGEALYIVKTYVNEPVRSVLAVTAQDQAEWDALRVERRLQEAELLAVDGRLNASLLAAIEEQVKDRVNDVNLSIAHLRENDDVSTAAEVSARLEITLRIHEQVLSKLAEQQDGEADSLHDQVKKHHDDAEKLEEDVEDEEDADDQDAHKADKQEAAEGKLKEVEHKIQEVQSFIEKAKISEQTRAAAAAKMIQVDALIVAGKANMAAEQYQEAFNAFKMAQREVQDVKESVASEQSVSERVRRSIDEHDDEAKDEGRGSDANEEKDKKDELRDENEGKSVGEGEDKGDEERNLNDDRDENRDNDEDKDDEQDEDRDDEDSDDVRSTDTRD